MTTEDVADIRLIHPHSALVDCPFLDSGEDRPGAIWTPYAELLPKIFTVVLKTFKCDFINTGDVVMFRPHHAQDYFLRDGRRLWAIDERACQVTLEGW
jgi:hypothetical protein